VARRVLDQLEQHEPEFTAVEHTPAAAWRLIVCHPRVLKRTPLARAVARPEMAPAMMIEKHS
jgi:hypothetical protein